MAFTGAACAKVVLCIFNILLLLTGAGLAAIGIWFQIDNTILEVLDFVEVASDDNLLMYGSYLLIAVGGVAMIFAIFGLIAAIKRNACMLGTYAFILLLIIMIEVAGAVLAIVYKDMITEKLAEKAKDELGDDLLITTEEDDGEVEKVFTVFGGALSFVQYEFECCGIAGYSDYEIWGNRDNKTDTIQNWKVLPTCCFLNEDADDTVELRKSPAGGEEDDDPSELVEDWAMCNTLEEGGKYTVGCEEGLLDWFEDRTYILIGVAICVACIQLLGFILALCLCQYPRNKDV